MTLSNGSYRAWFFAQTVLGNTVATFNHALGTTPAVRVIRTLNSTLSGIGNADPVIASRTTSYIALFNGGATTWVGDVECDSIHDITR